MPLGRQTWLRKAMCCSGVASGRRILTTQRPAPLTSASTTCPSWGSHFFFKPQNRGKKIKIKKMTAGEFVWHAPVFVFTKKKRTFFFNRAVARGKAFLSCSFFYLVILRWFYMVLFLFSIESRLTDFKLVQMGFVEFPSVLSACSPPGSHLFS